MRRLPGIIIKGRLKCVVKKTDKEKAHSDNFFEKCHGKS